MDKYRRQFIASLAFWCLVIVGCRGAIPSDLWFNANHFNVATGNITLAGAVSNQWRIDATNASATAINVLTNSGDSVNLNITGNAQTASIASALTNGARGTNLTFYSSGPASTKALSIWAQGLEQVYVNDEGAHFPTAQPSDVDVGLAGLTDVLNDKALVYTPNFKITDGNLTASGGAVFVGDLSGTASSADTVSSAVTNQWKVDATNAASDKVTLLQNSISYFVDPTNGVDSADGLTWATAFRTIQRAVNKGQLFHLGTNNVIIVLTNGTYFGCISVRGAVANTDYLGRLGMIDIRGVSPADTIIEGTNAVTHVIVSSMGARVRVGNMTLRSSSTNILNLLDAQIGGYLAYSNVTFGAMTGSFTAHVASESGGITTAQGNYTIAGSANAHLYALMGGSMWSVGNTVTISGTPAFSSAFLLADTGGSIRSGDTYIGSATGMRFSATANGVIYTPGITNYAHLPGDIEGINHTGGQYTDGWQFRLGGSNLVVMPNGFVGVGTSNALVRFDVMHSLAGNGVGSTAARIGRYNVPAVVNDGVQIQFYLFDGAGVQSQVAGVAAFIVSTNSTGKAGTLSLTTRGPGDSSPQVRMTVQTNGNVTITGGVDPRTGNLTAPAAITVGSSPTSYTNTSGYAEAIFVDAGTVSAIAINGTTVFTSAGKTIELQNNEYVTVTYSVAPTMKRKPL